MRKMIVLLLLMQVFLYAEEEDTIRELLLLKDDTSYKFNETITYITRVNMGIPGGDNWLVGWSMHNSTSRFIILYSINNNEVINRMADIMDFDPYGYTDYDIMQDIPGRRIGESCAIYDYNNDGYDEVFAYTFSLQPRIIISGYNKEDNDLRRLCSIPFDLVDEVEGPAPVEFLEYKGMKGFKVYYDLHYGTPMNPPQNIINEYYAWYFFAWDEESQEFVEVCEYLEEEETVESAGKIELSAVVPLPHPYIGKITENASDNVKIGGRGAAVKGSVSRHDSPLHLQLPGTIRFVNPPDMN